MSQNEVELTATLGAIHLVEAVSPVDTHKSHHGEEDTNTQASTAFDLQGIELAGVGPCITAFNEAQTIDRGVTQHEGITQFECHTRVGITLGAVWSERTVLVSTQAECFFGVAR